MARDLAALARCTACCMLFLAYFWILEYKTVSSLLGLPNSLVSAQGLFLLDC